MKSAHIFKQFVIGLAALGMCLPNTAFSASPTPTPVVHDVALLDGGVLLGQLVDRQGGAVQAERVTLLLEQRPIAAAQTDANGCFAFRGVRGGMYQLAAAEGVGVYRLWAPGTAPKVAEQGALVVVGQDVVRGQHYYYDSCTPSCGGARFWLSNPWVVAGIVATAVAVPVGIHNAGRGAQPVSP